jgi:ATP-binding cassette subfamily B (MDR/TAP) protein 8
LGFLIVAIVSALATAYLNIEIPQSLGRIVNVVASFVRRNGSDAAQPISSFLSQIHDPAIKMVKMYLAQGKYQRNS